MKRRHAESKRDRHANNDGDRVTMYNDGSSSIRNDGSDVQFEAKESTVLEGGESVSRGSDGSPTASETAANGGTMSTTLDANGGGVDDGQRA